MTSSEYITAANSFNGGDEEFSLLLKEGFAITGISNIEFAYEMGVIASTVRRWMSGATKPMDGMQKVAIHRLSKRVALMLDNEGKLS